MIALRSSFGELIDDDTVCELMLQALRHRQAVVALGIATQTLKL